MVSLLIASDLEHIETPDTHTDDIHTVLLCIGKVPLFVLINAMSEDIMPGIILPGGRYCPRLLRSPRRKNNIVLLSVQL